MKTSLPKEMRELAQVHSRLSKVFSHPQRILILWLLEEREQTVSEIARAIGASCPRTSQHLLLMRNNNILESHREQKNIFYRIVDKELLKNYPLVPLGFGSGSQNVADYRRSGKRTG